MEYDSFASPKGGPKTPKAKGSRPQNIPSQSHSKNNRSQGTPDSHRRANSHHHARQISNSNGYGQHDGALSDTGHTGSSMTPAKQAYAGPTFHASPAASALPMPKFMSKSNSDKPPSGLQARLDAESDRNDQQTETEDDHDSDAPVARENSPLDIFFRAQRAEKARNGSPLAQMSSNSPTNSQRALRSPPYHAKTPASSSKAMFMMEIDGAAETTDSDAPGHGVPFQERLRAASNSSTPRQPAKAPAESRTADKSAALKKLLSMPTSKADQADKDCSNPFDSPLRGPGPPGPPNYGPYQGSHQVYGQNFRHGNGPGPQHAYQPGAQAMHHQSPRPGYYQPNAQYHHGPQFAQAHHGVNAGGSFNFEDALRASANGQRAPEVHNPAVPQANAAAPGPESTNIQQMEDNLRKILKLG